MKNKLLFMGVIIASMTIACGCDNKSNQNGSDEETEQKKEPTIPVEKMQAWADDCEKQINAAESADELYVIQETIRKNKELSSLYEGASEADKVKMERIGIKIEDVYFKKMDELFEPIIEKAKALCKSYEARVEAATSSEELYEIEQQLEEEVKRIIPLRIRDREERKLAHISDKLDRLFKAKKREFGWDDDDFDDVE